jgi:hypothetical protein
VKALETVLVWDLFEVVFHLEFAVEFLLEEELGTLLLHIKERFIFGYVSTNFNK